ncbi:MAG: 2TM domain-containing protein [Chloroflexi bacterium]|nr:2TM domain-containing protein [Chloroflexota bacterium]OJW04384.1 MAG: hypothetical protein BGO39_11550 [Chloroflexi bacterium 54-19]
MAENRGFGPSQEDANYWPPIDESSTPRYQAPNVNNSFSTASSVWSETPPSIPVHILKQAEERVVAQKSFFKQLFIYLGVISVMWLVGISLFFAHYYDSDRMIAVYIPLLITMIGGLKVTYSYFNAFIWLRKSHQKRVMEEAFKIMS